VGEYIQEVPVTSVSLDVTLQGTLESIDQAAVPDGLKTLANCFEPLCSFKTTFTAGSVVVKAEATVPVTEAASVGAVTSSFKSLASSSTVALGDALGVKVEGVTRQVTAQQRTMTIIVAPPPPNPPSPYTPPVAPNNSGDGVLSTGVLIGIIVGALALLIALVVFIFVWKRKRSRDAKVAPGPPPVAATPPPIPPYASPNAQSSS